MPKYITFTVTPADGSPYEFWINADLSGNTINADMVYDSITGDLIGTKPYAIFNGGVPGGSTFGSDSWAFNLYAVPVGTPVELSQNAGAPALWYARAIEKARSSNADEIFVEADGLPPDGISAITGVCPTL